MGAAQQRGVCLEPLIAEFTVPSVDVDRKRCWTPQDLRWLRRFRTGALVLLVAVGGPFLIWIFRAAEQRNAVVAIENAGGRVVYSEKNRSDSEWRHFVSSVAEVHLRADSSSRRQKQAAEKALQAIASLADLKGLRLRGEITDEQLECLTGLELENLEVARTRITDAGLVHIGRLARLRRLHLGGTAITDAGLEELLGLTYLEWLNVEGTRVTREGLTKLGRLPNLKTVDSDLKQARKHAIEQIEHWGGSISKDKMRGGIVRAVHLSHTEFGDDRVSVLSGLPDLEELNLAGTRITDAGLAGLNVCPKLQDLILSATAVSDDGIASLTELRNLRRVNLYRTKVTHEGIRELRLAFPGIKITY
jgi:hypothetical protein